MKDVMALLSLMPGLFSNKFEKENYINPKNVEAGKGSYFLKSKFLNIINLSPNLPHSLKSYVDWCSCLKNARKSTKVFSGYMQHGKTGPNWSHCQSAGWTKAATFFFAYKTDKFCLLGIFLDGKIM